MMFQLVLILASFRVPWTKHIRHCSSGGRVGRPFCRPLWLREGRNAAGHSNNLYATWLDCFNQNLGPQNHVSTSWLQALVDQRRWEQSVDQALEWSSRFHWKVTGYLPHGPEVPHTSTVRRHNCVRRMRRNCFNASVEVPISRVLGVEKTGL